MRSGLRKRTDIIFLLSAVLIFTVFCLFTAVAFAEEVASPAGMYLAGSDSMLWPCGLPFEEPGYLVLDADGDDVSDYVEITGEVCPWKVGDYVLSYRFRDVDGQEYEKSRTVKVVANPAPETVKRENTIYLTFDDGPCQYTEQVLDALDKYGAKATFFVICNRDDPYFYLVSEILERGHSLGIHCSDHEYSRLYSSEKYFFEDIMEAQQLLYEETGSYATVTRFPGGSDTAYNLLGRRTEGGFDTIKQRMNDMGLRFYDWNVKTEGSYVTGEDMIYSFMTQVPAAEVPISLQHDTRLYSVKMVERFLSWGTANGYSFAAIDTSTPEVHARTP